MNRIMSTLNCVELTTPLDLSVNCTRVIPGAVSATSRLQRIAALAEEVILTRSSAVTMWIMVIGRALVIFLKEI